MATVDIVRTLSDAKPPKVIHRVDPIYTQDARDNYVQGTVVLETLVDEQGRPTHIHVINPIGFGLDERARAAVSQWQFEPGTRNGEPARVPALVEVTFRLIDYWYDSTADRRRMSFNLALHHIQQRDRSTEESVHIMQDLARQKLPAAMHMVGSMMLAGQLLPKDPEQAYALIAKSAEQRYGPAMYELGAMYLRGEQVLQDTEKGMRLIEDAAVLGSSQAQFFLGAKYELEDASRARRYYRLCATAGQPVCQLRLGKSMLNGGKETTLEPRADWRRMQALAWLRLAANHGGVEARLILLHEPPTLTAEDARIVDRLEHQLIR